MMDDSSLTNSVFPSIWPIPFPISFSILVSNLLLAMRWPISSVSILLACTHTIILQRNAFSTFFHIKCHSLQCICLLIHLRCNLYFLSQCSYALLSIYACLYSVLPFVYYSRGPERRAIDSWFSTLCDLSTPLIHGSFFMPLRSSFPFQQFLISAFYFSFLVHRSLSVLVCSSISVSHFHRGCLQGTVCSLPSLCGLDFSL